jgi:ribosome maturation factor RimP
MRGLLLYEGTAQSEISKPLNGAFCLLDISSCSYEVGLVPIFYLWCRSKKMAARTEVLQKIVEPVVKALGFQLWGIEYLGQGRHTLLRIFIDKEGGINIEDCAEASRHISSILDVEDPISSEYTLEVSSPGLDRILFTQEQLQAHIGDVIKVRLTESFAGRRNFSGQLKNIVDDEIVLIVGEEEFTIPYELIEKANVVSDP